MKRQGSAGWLTPVFRGHTQKSLDPGDLFGANARISFLFTNEAR